MKIKTIGASEAAYKVVMKMKQAMERASEQSVSMGEALDELLGVRLRAKFGKENK